MRKWIFSLFIYCIATLSTINAQHSVARLWSEELLSAIRNDFARPTVHARNLFHISAAMYDGWAAYSEDADTYFLSKNNNGFYTPFSLTHIPDDVRSAQEATISYAAYRLIKHRFQNAPSFREIEEDIDQLMEELGYDVQLVSTAYQCGAAQLGNYIAAQIIEYGYLDGANEEDQYTNQFYNPVNPPILIQASGNPNLIDFDRWQPIEFFQFIDQSGNPIGDDSPEFLSPEWGSVFPFSLQDENASTYQKDGFDYKVFFDPGEPAKIDDTDHTGLNNPYKWGHSMVSVWSSHLDESDSTLWDISPASIGNITEYPTDINDYSDFYNFYDGGDYGEGYDINPVTNLPYEPQIAKRSDYARVLAEFWADGPDSETPPGHWFTILNEIVDHPDFTRRFMGSGAELDPLEWDVKSYFALGGAMHDAAISVWGIKGWYDYIRPVSAIRGMAERGQGSDPTLPSYDPYGLPLIPGYIELVDSDDPLHIDGVADTGDIKILAWRGPNFISNPATDEAGVDWILAKNWWPYQRPTFVTPPFAGYVSGHSTFSRAAAEVLTALTGDAYFPGGMGEFRCPQNSFLVFEDGPSEDIILQWATYRDASDQCSLSRIWGGIHPPVDDIPGRLIGEQIGIDAFNFALQYFSKSQDNNVVDNLSVFPNPTDCSVTIAYDQADNIDIQVYQMDGKLVMDTRIELSDSKALLNLEQLDSAIYIIVAYNEQGEILFNEKVVVL